MGVSFLRMPLLIYLLLGFTGYGFAEEQKHSVLIIESYHKEYGWDRGYLEGIKQVFGDRYRLDQFELDTKRKKPDEFGAQVQSAWAYFQQYKPDLVILGDDNAVKFLGPKLQKSNTLVVFLGLNANPREYGIRLSSRFTGILERPVLRRSLFKLGQLVKVRRALLLFDNGPTSQAIKSESFGNDNEIMVRQSYASIELVSDFETWKQLVKQSQPLGYDIIIIGTYHTIRDKEDHHVSANEVMAWTTAHAKLPIFAFWDFAVGQHKAIGGLVLRAKEQGILAAKLAESVLKNPDSEDNYIRSSQDGRLMFSRAQWQKWQFVMPDKWKKEKVIWVE